MKFWNGDATFFSLGGIAWWRQVAIGLALLFCLDVSAKPPPKATNAVTLVVLDPLAKELACACVKGFGQRDYRKLAARLESALAQRVGIEFSDDLVETVALLGLEQEYVVVGERSLLVHQSKSAKLDCKALCDLTGLNGETSLNALFVVRSDDPAKDLGDLKGRKVIFGINEADQKYEAAMQMIRAAAVQPGSTEKRLPYTDAALDVLDSAEAPHPVAVIPGYGLKLLQGCGTINPGDLKVIGRTEAVPFITLFASDNIAEEKKKKILESLLSIKDDAKLMKEMETKEGFKLPVFDEKQPPEKGGGVTPSSSESNKKATEASAVDWPDWRGAKRDGRVPQLPSKLPGTLNVVWKKATMPGGLSGLSVKDGRLIVAERDLADEKDVYRCLNADTGELIWRVTFPAPGFLDYGQFPRATPVITDQRAYLLGAFGELRCVSVVDGKLLWKRDLIKDFQAELLTWGMSATPLIVDNLLIVNPGATNASLAALDPITGETRWTVPGKPAAYASFILGEFGGRRQIVGYDENSLGGWDVKTGVRLWELVPPARGDFNVPTPVAVEGGVIVSTENNGTRLYRFDDSGRIIPKPDAVFEDLFPDTATPVVTAGRLFGAHLGLRCLDVRDGLKGIWHADDRAIGDYASLIADEKRVLVVTLSGELRLLDVNAGSYTEISRLRVFEEDVEVYSHPALVGSRLYLRGGSSLLCVDLGEKKT